ncbi:tail sheath protein [Xanthomonas phage Xoo-sp13]|nr:tail sheath protein [Xanthomonas phage Xoo-sp13]
MALISAGVEVNVKNESVYVPGRAATVPLIFIATAAEKFQEDGVTPALGTYEHGVLRVVTSVSQALELYGVPKFLTSAGGLPHHGDARNEYGLDALLKFLEVGNRAYVVRANINTNDNYVDVKSLWQRKVAEAGDLLNLLVEDYITAYNDANQLFESDPDFKRTVSSDELTDLVAEAMSSVYSTSSFSTDQFNVDFDYDHTVNQAGYQDVLFNTSGGFLQTSDITGLDSDTTYSAAISVTSGSGTEVRTVAVLGSQAVTFGALIARINTALGATGSASFVGGRLRIQSSLQGATSAVDIVQDGSTSGSLPLFSNLTLYSRLAAPISGSGPTPLVVYDDSFTTIVGTYDGLQALITDWNAGSVVIDEFTADEAEGLLLAAAADFDNTKEFRVDTSIGSNDSTRRTRIVEALQAQINNPNNGIREENLEYNLAIAPGYFECADELLRLSTDMLSEIFVIGETPFDKPPVGPNGVNTWARTPARATSDNIAYWYGHGISSNIDGKDIMTTAGSTALRVLAYNDAETEVWFAPAGTTRGQCEHLTDTGYVTGALGGPTTFVSAPLDVGQRDELYAFPKSINPITFIPGRGILVLGQKTTSATTSAMDRINVSRLVKFMKRQIRKALFDFLFEPNDDITRKNVKYAVDNFCLDLVNRRALYDYATIVDDTNNSPTNVDNNELHVDIAIKPTKAVEFIYATIRIVNTGDDIGTGRSISVGQ